MATYRYPRTSPLRRGQAARGQPINNVKRGRTGTRTNLSRSMMAARPLAATMMPQTIAHEPQDAEVRWVLVAGLEHLYSLLARLEHLSKRFLAGDAASRKQAFVWPTLSLRLRWQLISLPYTGISQPSFSAAFSCSNFCLSLFKNESVVTVGVGTVGIPSLMSDPRDRRRCSALLAHGVMDVTACRTRHEKAQ